MAEFSKASLEKLETCCPELQLLFKEVIKHYDCTVICGYRNKEDQETAFREGKSQKHFPGGNHNKFPSLAVDVAPCPINWSDANKFYHFAGFVLGVASQLGIKIRWGGNWDMDADLADNKFMDLPHFEFIPRTPASELAPFIAALPHKVLVNSDNT